MDERLNRIIDFFDAWDLVQLLGITTEEILLSFPDEIEDKLLELEELMGLTNE